MRGRWLTAGAVAAFGLGSAAQSARAQVYVDAPHLWTELGPSITPSLVLAAKPGTVKPGFQLRAGTLAGLPVQVEVGVLVVPNAEEEKTATSASIGLRLLPFGWTHDMKRTWGGGAGNNVGLLIGYSTTGAYGGFTYELMPSENVGFVMELVTPFGANPSGLPRMVTLNLGAKFQLPAFGPLRRSETEPPPANAPAETPPPPATEPKSEPNPEAAPTENPPEPTPAQERRDEAEAELDEAAPTPTETTPTELTPPAASTPDERRDEQEEELDELAPMPVPEELHGPTSGATPEARRDEAEEELDEAEAEESPAPEPAPAPKNKEEAPREAPPPLSTSP